MTTQTTTQIPGPLAQPADAQATPAGQGAELLAPLASQPASTADAPEFQRAEDRGGDGADGAASGQTADGARRGGRRVLAGALSAAVVAGVFGFAMPHLASYRAVWVSLSATRWPSLLAVAAALCLSQVATWAMITAVLPRLRLREAAAVNLSSSAVANTVPGGGALALGVSWAMMSGWGVGGAEYAQYTLVSGLWNVFARLGLPVAAAALIAAGGQANADWLAAAGAGAAMLAVAVAALWAVLRSERVAASADRGLHRALAALTRLARRGAPRRASGMVLEFRAGTSRLLAGRWRWISATTLASHVSLWLVLLACLRASGVTGSDVSWAASLAAFAFVRLISVLPITPGGLGVVELGLAGPMAAGLGPAAAGRIAAAVLLFRALTYLLPLPAGAAAYLWWRRGARRRRGLALAADSRSG